MMYGSHKSGGELIALFKTMQYKRFMRILVLSGSLMSMKFTTVWVNIGHTQPTAVS
jgi:hypothetical protein